MAWLQWEPSLVPAETSARAPREAVMAAPPFACHLASGLCLCSDPCFPPSTPCYRAPQSCHLMLSFHCHYQSASWAGSPNCRSQHPDPVCTRRRPSQAGARWAVARTVCADLTLSAPGQVPCSFPSPWNTPSVSADPLTGEGTSPDVKILSHFQLPSRSKDLIPPPLLFLFPSAFHPAWLYGTHSFPFMCLKSSASIQQVLCENFSIFEVFLMYLWGEMNSMFSCPLLSWKVLIFFFTIKNYWFFLDFISSLLYLYLLWSFISFFLLTVSFVCSSFSNDF